MKDVTIHAFFFTSKHAAYWRRCIYATMYIPHNIIIIFEFMHFYMHKLQYIMNNKKCSKVRYIIHVFNK